MEALLDQVEVRVLGSLVEKQITTPEYYPLTLNALMSACNQKSNRDPVIEVDEKTVARGLESLQGKQLARTVSGAEMRVPRYYHLFPEVFQITPEEVAVLCVLMLRGPQTVGEIRGRSNRLYDFADLAEAEHTLQQLRERAAGALVKELPRLPGRKEPRFAHLLAGEPEVAAEEGEPPVEAATVAVRAENERLDRLEDEVRDLRQEVESLSRELQSFREQFE